MIIKNLNAKKSIIDVINSLPNCIKLKPASLSQIINAEKQLKLKFSDEYREYLKNFGAIISDGIELSGIANEEYRNVVALTKKEWELNSKVPHNMYVIEDTRINGIIIWQDFNGYIYKSTPNSSPMKIHDSLTEYISFKSNKIFLYL